SVKTMQCPKCVHKPPGARPAVIEQCTEGCYCIKTNTIHKLVCSSKTDRQIVMIKMFDQRAYIGCCEINAFMRLAFVCDAPDTSARLVALGMIKRNLIVSDDTVIEIGDV